MNLNMTMKNKIIVMSVFITLLALFVFLCPVKPEKPVEKYYVKNNVFTNNEQGYSFKIPDGFTLNDEFYPMNIRFESPDTVIEIYQEDLVGNDQLSYIVYTTEAITKDTLHYTNVKNFTDSNKTILSWDRNKLSKIENDKNHYMKIDYQSDNTVHTLLIKSSQTLDDYKTYSNLFKIKRKRNTFHKEYAMKKASPRTFNAETQKFFNDTFINSNDLTWGIFHPDYLDDNSLATFEKEINHKYEIALWYAGFTKEYEPTMVGGFLNKAYADGKITEMTMQPLLEHEAGNDLFKMLNGEYDAFWDECAKVIADFGHPVLFRFANEMNGDWCEYSAYRMSLDTELYRELYKYVYSFFEKHNANNVIWIWNPNGKSFPNYKWNSEDMYYPGNDYVDVLGLTLYNTGNYYPGEYWIEFSDLYKPLYENSMKKYDMPFMITEFSCARAGGNKEAWTRKMLSEIDKYDNIKVAVWWNSADKDESKGKIARAYYINDSEEMKTIFREYFENKKQTKPSANAQP